MAARLVTLGVPQEMEGSRLAAVAVGVVPCWCRVTCLSVVDSWVSSIVACGCYWFVTGVSHVNCRGPAPLGFQWRRFAGVWAVAWRVICVLCEADSDVEAVRLDDPAELPAARLVSNYLRDHRWFNRRLAGGKKPPYHHKSVTY